MTFFSPQSLGVSSAYLFELSSCPSHLHHSPLLTSRLKLETAAWTMILQPSCHIPQLSPTSDTSYVGIIWEVKFSDWNMQVGKVWSTFQLLKVVHVYSLLCTSWVSFEKDSGVSILKRAPEGSKEQSATNCVKGAHVSERSWSHFTYP